MGEDDQGTAEIRTAELGVTVTWGPTSPVRLSLSRAGESSPWGPRPLVDLFTATEQRARTSEGYLRSIVGERLRHVGIVRTADERAEVLEVDQVDEVSLIRVTTRIEIPHGIAAVRIRSTVTHEGAAPLTLTGVTSASIGTPAGPSMRLLTGASEWLAEGRWREQPLADVLPDLSLAAHGQDGRGKVFQASRGTWSTGGGMPQGALWDEDTGDALAWQIESSGGWLWELGSLRDGARLTLTGPMELEHQFAVRLGPGESFESVPAVLVLAQGGRDGALAELTRYRRWLRAPRAGGRPLPVVYNDFMNTLMGDPTTERVLPLVDAAADSGAEVFCIDAGWYAEDPNWWDSVGEWLPSPRRFPGGLREVTDAILARGMRVGLWLEPEVVGLRSPMADRLPGDAFFTRFGTRVTENGRYQLDFRSAAARAHLDAVVDRLAADFGVTFLKLDYNINPGPGTERDGEAAGAGLLGHVRAYRDWLQGLQQRHPDLDLENCASGAMRADYLVLEVADLQSMTDQQDFRRQAVVSAAAPVTVLPEQAGNWAYPSEGMTGEETAFCLLGGIVGRLYLSGFLPRLRAEQSELVSTAVALHKELLPEIAASVPRWPLGLPGWQDDLFALALDGPHRSLLAVWSRGNGGAVPLPLRDGEIARQVFPPAGGPQDDVSEGVLVFPAGPSAALLVIARR